MELTVEKLIYGGDGLARLPAEAGAAADERRGKAVFLPFVLPGERVAATVVEEKPGFVRARTDALLRASPQRIEPGCPYYVRCGGCHYQHTSYQHQLQIKRDILAETVRRGAKIEVDAAQIAMHPSPEWNYRNRTRLKLEASPFALGYYRFGSHELLPVEQCPISSPLINRAIAAIWELGRAGEVSEQIGEIEFFANHDDAEMLVELTLAAQPKPQDGAVAQFARGLRRAVPDIVGVALFHARRDGSLQRVAVPDGQQDAFGENHIVYQAAEFDFRVSAGSFFQTNPHMMDELVQIVAAGETGHAALDLYSGVGLFAVALARCFAAVAAVEVAPFSYGDLERNKLPNVTTVRATTEDFLRQKPRGASARDMRAIDLAIIDPPRAGLGERVARMLADLQTPRLTYVSCDPSTLARDLRVLTASGYRVAEMHLVDLFPQTFHIESVIKLVR